MFFYFGYGSNMDLTALRAKGVQPLSSERATLSGYRLGFNVKHWFPLEGGVGNLIEDAAAFTEGVVHACEDQHRALLDAVESYKSGYDRIEVTVQAASGPIKALTYVGLPGYLDDTCLPTLRYLNILVRGAVAAGLSDAYVAQLRQTPVVEIPEFPRFSPSAVGPTVCITAAKLAESPLYTALLGHVFDMSEAPERLHCLHSLFGGKDMTLFIAKRHDSSRGDESLEDAHAGRLSAQANHYLNAYLHNYSLVFRYVGQYDAFG